MKKLLLLSLIFVGLGGCQSVSNTDYSKFSTDILSGGVGNDTFGIKNTPFVMNIITDFQVGEDKIMIRNITFQSLDIRQDNTDTIIDIGNNHIVKLQKVDSKTLTENDFISVTTKTTRK